MKHKGLPTTITIEDPSLYLYVRYTVDDFVPSGKLFPINCAGKQEVLPTVEEIYEMMDEDEGGD